MDAQRRRALLEQYKNRRPEMGVVCLRCTQTGDSFFKPSRDTRVDFNSLRAKLNSGLHPNRRLTELWKRHGPEGFEWSVPEVLDYGDPQEDYSEELELMCRRCMDRETKAALIWKAGG